MDDLKVEVSSVHRAIMVHNVLHFFAISIMYYDHLLTFGTEVDCIWRRPKSHSSYYFFLNRYFSFLGNLAVSVLGFINMESKRLVCQKYNLFRQLLLVITQVLICYFLTLRIYALYECSLRILLFMLSNGAVLVTVSCWALFGQKSTPAETGSGCHIGLSKITAIRLAAAWEALFLYDSMIFGLILYKTWSSRREYAYINPDFSLLMLVFRDGAIYFAVMALANLSNILTFYFSDPFLRGCLSTFASSLSVTMMSRLMLNLHQTAVIGIFSSQLTSTINDARTLDTRENMIELDTFWSVQDRSRGYVSDATRASVSVGVRDEENTLAEGSSRYDITVVSDGHEH